MSSTVLAAHPRNEVDETAKRLLESAATLSYDPMDEVDWDAPVPEDKYGLNPEWSTLYGTAAVGRDDRGAEGHAHQARGLLDHVDRHLVRDDPAADGACGTSTCKTTAHAEFQFALTEIADECRHSMMFARACQKMGVPAYCPDKLRIELGRGFKALARGETAYAGILVAEEVLDVMQRDWMRGENVQPIVRTTSKIHVVEESRHMKFARQEVRDALRGVESGPPRGASALVVAIAADVIVSNMVNPAVYAAAGLDIERALAAAKANEHRQTMMRTSCRHLMDFLGEIGLLTQPAAAIYRRLSML